jgi:hypothetical protein
MDKIIAITLGLFIIILGAVAGMLIYNGYMETAYRNSVTGTYTYTCTITTDSSLSNVTLFIPVPVDRSGNSPMVSEFSDHRMTGVPVEWKTALFDTGKATMLKIMTPAIVPPSGTGASYPYTIIFSSASTSRDPIDTRNPVENSVMFRPVHELREVSCQQGISDSGSRCSTYLSSIYADYTTTYPNATVSIKSAVAGRNTWTIFGPYSNEYHTEISLIMTGENHGWAVPEGVLTSSIGTYIIPAGH